MSPAVLTRGLTKRYRGRTVVDGLDLVVPRGVVYGFLGPNGAGKSTSMKMLLGLTEPSAGEVELFGTRLTHSSRGQLLRSVGAMVESPPGYGHLTGRENLQVVRAMLGLSEEQVDRALATVRLTAHQHRLVRQYSLGMKQRLGIAMALVRDPTLLVLDEPTNGLDPAGIEEVRSLLVELAEQGTTVLVSSHLLDEVDRTATVLGILAQGRLIFQGTRAELLDRSQPDVVVETPAPQRAAQVLQGARVVPGGVAVPGLDRDRTAEAVRRLVAADVPVHEVRRTRQSLEDVFMDLTGREGQL